jgi:hypothetical protein
VKLKQDNDEDNYLDLPMLVLIQGIQKDEHEMAHHFELLFDANAFGSKEEAKRFTC